MDKNPLLQIDPATGTVSEVGRDPELRRAALEALLAFDGDMALCGVDPSHPAVVEAADRLVKAMDALKEALAK